MPSTYDPSGSQSSILVIGFGNALRRDDALGLIAAETVASWSLSGVVARSVPTLLPELAIPLAAAHAALIIDARLARPGDRTEVSRIEPNSMCSSLGHLGNPAQLLALAHNLFDSSPPTWLITIPAHDLSMGEGLSPMAQYNLKDAMRVIMNVLHNLRSE